MCGADQGPGDDTDTAAQRGPALRPVRGFTGRRLPRRAAGFLPGDPEGVGEGGRTTVAHGPRGGSRRRRCRAEPQRRAARLGLVLPCPLDGPHRGPHDGRAPGAPVAQRVRDGRCAGCARADPDVHLLPLQQHPGLPSFRRHPGAAGPIPAPGQRNRPGGKRPGGPQRRDRPADLRRLGAAGDPGRCPRLSPGPAGHERPRDPRHPHRSRHDQAAERRRGRFRCGHGRLPPDPRLQPLVRPRPADRRGHRPEPGPVPARRPDRCRGADTHPVAAARDPGIRPGNVPAGLAAESLRHGLGAQPDDQPGQQPPGPHRGRPDHLCHQRTKHPVPALRDRGQLQRRQLGAG